MEIKIVKARKADKDIIKKLSFLKIVKVILRKHLVLNFIQSSSNNP